MTTQTRRTPGAGEHPGGPSKVSVATADSVPRHQQNGTAERRHGQVQPTTFVTHAGTVISTRPTHMPDAWHEQTEHEGRWWYSEGYADGYAAAERAIAAEIVSAIGIKPHPAKKVIQWLIRDINSARPRRAPRRTAA